MKRRIAKTIRKADQNIPSLPFKSLNIPKIAYHNRACLLLKRGEIPQQDEYGNLYFNLFGLHYILPRKLFKETYDKFCPA